MKSPFVVPDVVRFFDTTFAAAAAAIANASVVFIIFSRNDIVYTLTKHLHLLKLYRQHRGLYIVLFHCVCLLTLQVSFYHC